MLLLMKVKQIVAIQAPTFQIYADSELDAVKEQETMSNALQQRLCQSTIANMISTTMALDLPRYPTKQEVKDMTAHLASVYPGNKHEGKDVCIFLRPLN